MVIRTLGAEKIAGLLAMVPLDAMRKDHVAELLTHASIETLSEGEYLDSHGESGLHVYLLEGKVEFSGLSTASFTRSGMQSRPVVLSPYGDTRLKALEPSMVLHFDSQVLDRLLSKSQLVDYMLALVDSGRLPFQEKEWVKTLLRSHLFCRVSPSRLFSVLDRMETVAVKEGQTILEQGEPGSCCYFVKSGQASVIRHDPITGAQQVLSSVGTGVCFGEEALLNETVRNATVIMSAGGELVRLNKSDFDLLLSDPQCQLIEISRLDEELDGGATLIDLRSPNEYRIAHLENSLNLPLSGLAAQQQRFDKEQRLILCCDTARRSTHTSYLLSEQGFSVGVLKGGLAAILPGNIGDETESREDAPR